MLTDTHKSKEGLEVVPDYVRMYYEHQYDRMAKLEEQGLIITNVVVTLSTVALTFGFSNAQGLSAVAGIGLPVVMFIVNGFAIFYIARTRSWIRTHQLRAKRVLKEYSPDLSALDETTVAPHRKGILGMGRRKLQIILHLLLMIASVLILLILYL